MDDLQDLRDLQGLDRVLVAGVGGGGDVVGCVPTATLLASWDVDPVLAGLAWERVPHDPHPGPRPLGDLEGVEAVAHHVARATPEAQVAGGVRFAEASAADHLPWPVLLLDVTDGPRALGEDLARAADELGLDAAVALDAGGDAIARGREEGIRSPLADALSLAAIDHASLPATVGVLGWGSDGELDGEELEAAYERAAAPDGILGAWGITPGAASLVEPLLEEVPTDASRLPFEAARGRLGSAAIRGGRRTVELGPAAPVTYYFPWEAVVSQSETVPLVADAQSIGEADRALREAGLRTELAFEEEWVADREP